MGVNRSLLPIKVHFFLYWGFISSVVPYMMVVARQLGVPVGVQGVVWALITTLALVAKPLLATLADAHPTRRRVVFLVLLGVMVCATTPIGFLRPLYHQPPASSSSSSSLSASQSYEDHVIPSSDTQPQSSSTRPSMHQQQPPSPQQLYHQPPSSGIVIVIRGEMVVSPTVANYTAAYFLVRPDKVQCAVVTSAWDCEALCHTCSNPNNNNTDDGDAALSLSLLHGAHPARPSVTPKHLTLNRHQEGGRILDAAEDAVGGTDEGLLVYLVEGWVHYQATPDLHNVSLSCGGGERGWGEEEEMGCEEGGGEKRSWNKGVGGKRDVNNVGNKGGEGDTGIRKQHRSDEEKTETENGNYNRLDDNDKDDYQRKQNKSTSPTGPQFTANGEAVEVDLINDSLPSVWTLPGFWLYFLLLLLGQIAAGTVESVSDAICCDIIGEGGDYGRQRVWGVISYGVLGLLSGCLVDLYSSSSSKGASADSVYKDYTPAFLLSAGCGLLDILLAGTRLKVPRSDKTKMREEEEEGEENGNLGREGQERSVKVWSKVKPLLTHQRVIVFLILAFLIGFFDGLDTTYVFVLQEDMGAGTSSMEHMKLVQGLTLLVQAVSAIPCMMLCDRLIKRLGSERVITLVVFLYSLRLLSLALASHVGAVWATVAVEVINGPCFGFGFTAVVMHASAITPTGTSTTMQSVVGVCYSTLGYAGASLVGGVVYEAVGGTWLYLLTGILAALTFPAHILYLCLTPTPSEVRRLELGVEFSKISNSREDLQELNERVSPENV